MGLTSLIVLFKGNYIQIWNIRTEQGPTFKIHSCALTGCPFTRLAASEDMAAPEMLGHSDALDSIGQNQGGCRRPAPGLSAQPSALRIKWVTPLAMFAPCL